MKDMTKLVEKYADNAQFPKMIGSGGGMDYLVIARNPTTGLQLGIKTLVGAGTVEGKQAILVGFRLRSAYIPGSGGSVSGIDGGTIEASQVTDKKEPHEGWAFPWESVGESSTGDRASLIRTVALNRTPDEAKWVFDDLDHIRFFGKLQAMLHEHVDDNDWLVTDDDLADYIRASIYPTILAMSAGKDPAKQLELLEMAAIKNKEHFASFEEQYNAKKAALQAEIEAGDGGEPEAYHPKAHFGDDDLVPMDSVAHAMLKGAKPKLGVVDGGLTDDEPLIASEGAAEPDEKPISIGADD